MYTNKLLEYVNTQSSNILQRSETNPITYVNNLRGGRVSMPVSQSKVIQKALCTANYTPASQYANMLSSGSSVDFNIKLSTVLGSAYDIALHMSVMNDTGADVELFPVTSWFNRVEFRFNTQIIQQWYTSDLYNYLWIWIDQEWRRVSDLLNLNDRFLPTGDIIADGFTQEFILLLPQNIFKETNMFCPALNVEFVLRLYMNQSSEIVRTGSAPSISNMYLEFITAHVLLEDVERLFNAYRSGSFQLRHYWMVNQTSVMQSMQPNTRYEFLMSSFTGQFNYLQFIAQPANASGVNLLTSRRLAAFDVLDENGLSYFNNNQLQSDSESLIWDSEIVNPFTRFDEVRNVYKYPFSLNCRGDLISGQQNGVMFLNGKSRFVLYTGDAATPKIVTLTQSGDPASGFFRVVYTYFGETQYTDWIAYNATVGTIKAAIEALPAFRQYDQEVTVSAQLDASLTPTITYSAEQELAFDEYDTNAVFIIESQMATAAPLPVQVNSEVTQYPQDGWFTGDYAIILFGTQIRYLCITPQGGIKISES